MAANGCGAVICCADSAPGVAAGPPASPAIFNLLQIIIIEREEKGQNAGEIYNSVKIEQTRLACWRGLDIGL